MRAYRTRPICGLQLASCLKGNSLVKEKVKKYLIVLLICLFLFVGPFYTKIFMIFLEKSLETFPKLIKIIKNLPIHIAKIKNLPMHTANIIIKIIDGIFIEKEKIEQEASYKSTKIFIYFLFPMLLIAFYYDFESEKINKPELDTIIVVFSLFSLILGRIFETYSSSSQKFHSYISLCLRHCAYSILLWLPLSLIANCIVFKICINSYSYQSWLEVIILLVSSFILLILSELAKIKNREKLLFAFWWIFILILYLIKMRTSK